MAIQALLLTCLHVESHVIDRLIVQEFELSCQMMLPNRSMDKPSIKWKVWKSRAQLQAFDEYAASWICVL